MKLAQTNLSKLHRSDLFVENGPAQAAQLRWSDIFGFQRKDAKAQRRQGTSENFFAALRLLALALKNDVAPTDLEFFSGALAAKIPRLRRCPKPRGISGVSLAPWLQPGVRRGAENKNRFNGFPSHAKAVETAGEFLPFIVHRAKAAVLTGGGH